MIAGYKLVYKGSPNSIVRGTMYCSYFWVSNDIEWDINYLLECEQKHRISQELIDDIFTSFIRRLKADFIWIAQDVPTIRYVEQRFLTLDLLKQVFVKSTSHKDMYKVFDSYGNYLRQFPTYKQAYTFLIMCGRYDFKIQKI